MFGCLRENVIYIHQSDLMATSADTTTCGIPITRMILSNPVR